MSMFSPFITQFLGPIGMIGMDCGISKLCYSDNSTKEV